ncbi:MAG: hypothetical protein LBV16_05720 [Elusimicrobiota bacterium]|nr:hypothetical protein [Elusimicrobiota bacterium]
MKKLQQALLIVIAILFLPISVYAATLEQLKASAYKGNAQASLELSRIYAPSADRTSYIYWLLMAADHGFVEAQRNLAVQFEALGFTIGDPIGNQIAKSFLAAIVIYYYQKAAEQGDEQAKKRLLDIVN